ncbi:MAG: ANTAR domain-containing protein [Jatrophihabitantaceae bacterium]
MAGELPIAGTIVCTWRDPSRPTDADAVVARLVADQAAAKLRLDILGSALHSQLLRTANLEEALATNREIGQAIGILMATDHVTAAQAFERLRKVSQQSHRKLRDVAADVAETGALVVPADFARAPVRLGLTPARPEQRVEPVAVRVQRLTRGGKPCVGVPTATQVRFAD